MDSAEKLGNDEWLANIYNNLAVFYANNKRLDEALTYIRKAIFYVEQTDNASDIVFAYQVECSIYMLRKESERGILPKTTLWKCSH